jgi:hypothetical protein
MATEKELRRSDGLEEELRMLYGCGVGAKAIRWLAMGQELRRLYGFGTGAKVDNVALVQELRIFNIWFGG